MLGLGLRGLSLGQRGGSGEPPIITATVAPVLTALTDAQTPADGFTSGTYASTAGTISSEVAAYLVNGSPEASSYDLTAGDTVRVSETVTDSAANERVFYTSTITVTPSVALSSTGDPVISGTFEVGETVSSTQGTWAGSAPRTYAYQWLREGEAIVGATSSTYALVEADEGADISCEVTADDGFTQVSAESTAEAVTWPAPVAAGLISAQSYAENIAITPLDVSADFTGGGITYALAPTSDALPAGLSLSSAGILSGTPTEEAAGLSIVVRGTNSGGSDDTTFSLTVEAALTAPVISGVPTISGTTAVGSVLTATAASATPTGTNTWQWERGGTPISGATSITYTLVEADEGSTLTVVQTCTNAAGSDTAESVATATITYPAPVAAGGLADQSYDENDGVKTVDASGDFTNAVGGSWSVNAATGISIDSSGVVSIDTATASSGTVIVTYTNSGGTDSSAFSLSVGADTSTHVFLLIGQSNMVGYDTFDGGAGFPANVYQYDQTGSIVPATVPLDHNDANASYMSLGLQFAIDYAAANPSATILLVPRAETNTSLKNNWVWNSALREGAIDAANAAMAAATDPVFKGILWHQGENDAIDSPSSVAYAANLRRLIEDLRDRINGADETTPFVCGEMLQGLSTALRPQQYQDIVNAALLGVQEDNAYTYGVSSTGLTDKGDSIHFDAASLRTLGSRYYTGLVAAQSAGPLAPEQPDTGDWTISAIGASGEAWLEVLSLPYCRGGKLTAIEYQIDGGAWVSLGHPYEGIYPIRGLTDDVAQSISIRGVSDAGNGTASATKSVTPYDDGFGNDFVFTVETTADAETFTVPTWSAFAYNCTIDWGDGASSTVTAYNDADLAHEYATAGQYQVRISGTFEAFPLAAGGAKAKIVSVEQLGVTGWKSIGSMFSGATNLRRFRAGSTNVSSISNSALTPNFLANCTALEFADLVGMVPTVAGSMAGTMSGCTSLKAVYAEGFNAPAATTFYEFAKGCTSLKVVHGLVIPATCTTLGNAFRTTSALEYIDTTGWDTSGITNMSYIFEASGLEAIDVSGWDTSSVTNITSAFSNASNIRDLAIDGWDVSNVTGGTAAFFNVFLPTSRYDATLIAWGSQTVQSGVSIDFGYTKYTAGGAAATGRANLVSAGWTIADDGTV